MRFEGKLWIRNSRTRQDWLKCVFKLLFIVSRSDSGNVENGFFLRHHSIFGAGSSIGLSNRLRLRFQRLECKAFRLEKFAIHFEFIRRWAQLMHRIGSENLCLLEDWVWLIFLIWPLIYFWTQHCFLRRLANHCFCSYGWLVYFFVVASLLGPVLDWAFKKFCIQFLILARLHQYLGIYPVRDTGRGRRVPDEFLLADGR